MRTQNRSGGTPSLSHVLGAAALAGVLCCIAAAQQPTVNQTAVAVAGETQTPTTNLLPNPSFEEKELDGVRGWTSQAWAGEEDGTWSVESPGRTREHCVSIASAKGADATWTTTVTVHPNAWYRLSGWINGLHRQDEGRPP